MLDLDFKIVFQNSDLLVLDKPSGISVHNEEGPGNLMALAEKQLGVGKLYPVHRLDKETSGVQVFAKSSKVASEKAKLFQDRAVRKLYQGILRGELQQKSGTWTSALSDKSEGRKNPAGLAKDRVECETRFQILQNSRYFTLCEFDLITGRQHQIRKHAALTKHPLVGDGRYGDPKYNQKIAALYALSRMFLHCTLVELDGQVFNSPVPHDFLRLFTNN